MIIKQKSISTVILIKKFLSLVLNNNKIPAICKKIPFDYITKGCSI